jgi:hypothetical protein
VVVRIIEKVFWYGMTLLYQKRHPWKARKLLLPEMHVLIFDMKTKKIYFNGMTTYPEDFPRNEPAANLAINRAIREGATLRWCWRGQYEDGKWGRWLPFDPEMTLEMDVSIDN